MRKLLSRLVKAPEKSAQLSLDLDSREEPEGIEEYAVYLLDRLCAEFPMGYRPTVAWKKLRVTAGLAHTSEGKISLSSILLDSLEKVERTLKHEYAHLLAVARHGRRATGHGKAWRQAMSDLGEAPEIYHRYPAKRNQSRQRVGYVCGKCGITIVRKRKLPGRRKYLHAKCGGVVKFAWAEKMEDQ
ncbi:MAG: SprT-like domain-containing protein [Fimbriimonadaceae bacterium]|nr:SprT-like domain-containing protein [Fimbriimonadaceae bacterium]